MAGLARILGMSAIALVVAGCGGGEKNPPDEFAVSTVKPLVLPENFAALPTPTPGTRSPLQPDPIAEARAVLLGETDPQPANARISASESALLASTGASEADPNIRTVLQAEQDAREASRPSYALEGIFPSIRRNIDEADALTPSEERVRLSETLPPRQIGSTEISTIPSATAPAPILPTGTAPAGQPAIDPVTGGELIYIPE